MSLKTELLKLWYDPVWSKVIAAGIIACLSFLFIRLRKRPLSKPKPKRNISQEQPISSATLDIPIPGNIPREQLSGFQTADSIEILRQSSGVRSLTEQENQLPLWELPDGVFGYVEAYKFNTPEMRILDRSDIERNFALNKYLQLCQSPVFNGYAEIHKSKNNNISLICFVTEEDRILLQNPSRTESVKLTVSLTKTQKRNRVIAIPRERLEYWRQRMLGDGECVGDARIS